ncbi:MAG: hypothetical protein F6K62_24945 [Sphaerospermopsis sp. SIO1G2]|nr:hypothetical protein [Sphaerospermopsis sp. SIO1G2]
MSSKRSKYGTCPLCHRTLDLTFHHLIPKKLHRRTHYRKNYSKETLNQGIDICRKCHSGLHAIYSEVELGKRFNTIEAITADEALQKHFAWVAKQRVQLRN